MQKKDAPSILPWQDRGRVKIEIGTKPGRPLGQENLNRGACRSLHVARTFEPSHSPFPGASAVASVSRCRQGFLTPGSDASLARPSPSRVGTSDLKLPKWRATQSPVYSGGNRAGFAPDFPCRPRNQLARVTPATVNRGTRRVGRSQPARPLSNSDTNYSSDKDQDAGLARAPRAACCCSSPSLLDYAQRGRTT